VLDRPVPCRAECKLTGPGFRQPDQLGHGVRGQIRVDDQHERQVADDGDGREIAIEIIAGLALHQRGIHRVSGKCRHQQRMTVVGGLGDEPRADIARIPGAAVDDDRLAEILGQLLPEYAGERVDRPARRKRHNDGDGFRRILLRANRRGDDCAYAEHGAGDQSIFHGGSLYRWE
jgi:hypothetical protein